MHHALVSEIALSPELVVLDPVSKPRWQSPELYRIGPNSTAAGKNARRASLAVCRTPTTLSSTPITRGMADRNDAHWDWKHAACVCSDAVEVRVREGTFLLDRKYTQQRRAAPSDASNDSSAQPRFAVPRSWVFYGRGCRPMVTVSGAALSRKADTILRAADGARTHTIPDTLRDVQQDAFEGNKTVIAVNIKERTGKSTRAFTNSRVRVLASAAGLKNVEKFLLFRSRTRKVVLPSGVWLRAFGKNSSGRTTMVVLPDVHEICYLPVYREV